MVSSISSPQSDADLRDFIVAVIGVEVFLVVFFNQCKVYDLATAALFAFALGLLARREMMRYLAVFALANVNRETTVLLTGVYLVYFFSRLEWKRYLFLAAAQVLIFFTIRLYIMDLFASRPGDMMLVRPLENLALFVKSPIGSLAHGAGLIAVIWLCARWWKSTHPLLQVALAVMGPALLVLYLVLGWSFEIRVFAEIYPVVWVMLWRL